MTTHVHNTQTAYRLGQATGRALRWAASVDRTARGWLVAQGLSADTAKIVLWVIKLVVFAALLYVAFWMVLMVTAVVVAAWAARDADPEDVEEMSRTEWRYGSAGYGLYTFDGHRIDPHDPQDEQE